MKKLKFGKIKIYFRDGKVDTIPRKLWDDYEYNGALFVVKRRGHGYTPITSAIFPRSL